MPAPNAFLHPQVDAHLRTILERRGVVEARERIRAMEALARTMRLKWIEAAARRDPERVLEALRLCLEEPWPEMHENVCIAARIIGEPVLSPLLDRLVELARGEEIVRMGSSSKTKRVEHGRARLAAVRALASFRSEKERLVPELMSVLCEAGSSAGVRVGWDARQDEVAFRDAARDSLVLMLQGGQPALQDAFGRALAEIYVAPSVDVLDPGSYLPEQVVGIEWLYRTPEFRRAAMLSACNRWEIAVASLPYLDEKGVTAVLLVWSVMRPGGLDELFEILVRRKEPVLGQKMIAALLGSRDAELRLLAIRHMEQLRVPEHSGNQRAFPFTGSARA